MGSLGITSSNFDNLGLLVGLCAASLLAPLAIRDWVPNEVPGKGMSNRINTTVKLNYCTAMIGAKDIKDNSKLSLKDGRANHSINNPVTVTSKEREFGNLINEAEPLVPLS